MRNKDQLDEDASRRLHLNPLRILDSKNPQVQNVVKGAPLLINFLSEEAKDHLAALQELLDAAQVNYVLNPRLVRGLDYYNRTVFEWVSTELGTQGTVCAGGRYDSLVEQMGGKATPAAGFAIGLERLHSLVAESLATQTKQIDAYIVALGESALRYGLYLAGEIRTKFPNLAIQMNCGGGSIKTQMKRADRSGARLALIIGEQEVAQQQVSVKYMQTDGQQQAISKDVLMELLQNEKKE